MILLSKIYFLGIGGIGMSALARYFNQRGVAIHGYDKYRSELCIQLEEEGMHIHYTEDISLIPLDCELIVRTPAIPINSIEYNFILSHFKNIKKRSQVLGEIVSSHRSIAVAGTHGKTSTSAMITFLLEQSGIPVTAFLGGVLSNYNSNFIDSGDKWMIAEADEFDRSFLQLYPDIAVINSLDADHLDIYGSREEMVRSYLLFASQIKENGTLLLSHHISESEVEMFINAVKPSVEVIQFGGEDNEVFSRIVKSENARVTFDYCDKSFFIYNLEMDFPGTHNVENATAGIYIAKMLGVSSDSIKISLSKFRGIKRRFEKIFDNGRFIVIDDYAHHPTELKAAIDTAKSNFQGKKILGVFQPHLYSRTQLFFNEFAHELSQLDSVILLDIYPAREVAIPGVNSSMIIEKMLDIPKQLCVMDNLIEEIRKMNFDVILVLGAGDIDTKLGDIVDYLKSIK